jgi:hypothetical protein
MTKLYEIDFYFVVNVPSLHITSGLDGFGGLSEKNVGPH